MQQHYDTTAEVYGKQLYPMMSYRQERRLNFKRIFTFRQITILLGAYRCKIGPAPLIQTILKTDIISYRKERKA